MPDPTDADLTAITEAELDETEARLKHGDNFLIRKDAWTLHDALRACRQQSKAKDAALELFLKYIEHPDVKHAAQLWEKETGGRLLTSVPINQALAALGKGTDD